jgi:hypothetical protein
MEFQGAVILDGYPTIQFNVTGEYRRFRKWPNAKETVVGDLVLTVARVPYFAGPIVSGQRAFLRIPGLNRLPITLSTVEQPRLNLQTRNLEFSVTFTSEEAIVRNRNRVVLGQTWSVAG